MTPKTKEKKRQDRIRRLQDKKPAVATVQLVTDSTLQPRLARAVADGDGSAIAELEQQLEDATVVLSFRSIGRATLAHLTAEHPATESEKTSAKELGIDPSELPWGDSFGPALLAAALIPEEGEEPLTEEDFATLEQSDTWTAADFQALFLAAFRVQQASAVAEVSK